MMEDTGAKSAVRVFESGITSDEYRFLWNINNLDLAFKAGSVPCPSLISELSMQFKTGDRVGQPTTWQFFLEYGRESKCLLVKAAPMKSGSGEFFFLDSKKKSFHATLEVEDAGEFTLLEQKTAIVKVFVNDATEDNRKTSGSSSSFKSPTTLPYGRAFAESNQQLKFPLVLALFHCDAGFLNSLENAGGCVALSMKFTLLDCYFRDLAANPDGDGGSINRTLTCSSPVVLVTPTTPALHLQGRKSPNSDDSVEIVGEVRSAPVVSKVTMVQLKKLEEN